MLKELSPSDHDSNELSDIKSKYETLCLNYKSLREQLKLQDHVAINLKEKDFIIASIKEENKDWRNKVEFF